MKLYFACILITVATVSFSQSEFVVIENEESVKVELVRSGDISSEVTLLIGNDPYRGSATGIYL